MRFKHLLAIFSCLFLTTGFFACSDDDSVPPPSITVEPAEGLVFEAEGGTQRLSVEAQGGVWTVEKSDAWITVAADAAAGRIEVTVGLCDDTQGRNGTVTVLGGAEPVVVKIVQKGVVPVLTVTPTQLDFDDPDAAFKIVEVTASHVEWQVEQSAEKWITAEADREAGTIRVSVEENTDAAPRNGTFRITGEGVEPVTVTVTQPQAVPFWERSIAYRMGYQGAVKSVGRHIDLVNNDGEVELYDLQFDKAGNLTQFTREEDAMTVTVAYDDRNRITEIAAKASEYDFSLLLEYGAHGKYIPTFEVFEYDLDEMFPVDFRVWMPFLIKDLAVLKVRDRLLADNNLDYRFTVEGDRATLDCCLETGESWYPEYYTIDFAGDYPKQLDSEGAEYATYEIDAPSGKIQRQTMHSYYEIAFERALDRRNTISRAVYGSYDMTMTYNEQLDVAKRTMNAGSDGMYPLTATYAYDETGNWTQTTITPESGSPVTASRTIDYWE